MHSFLTHLECTYCGELFSSERLNRLCELCGKVLYPRYDIASARKHFVKEKLIDRSPNMWRYFEMLPVREWSNVVTLGEGFTPIFRVKRLGEMCDSSNLLIKDEGLNPTASFKARGLSAAVSKAKELGVLRLTMPSAGNAAGAMSSYAARAGMEAYVFMPKDAPEANLIEVSITGGNLNLVDGLISDAGVISRQRASELDLFDVSTLQEPYRVEGKKTMGYEIAEQLDWKLPDSIIYPTGGGTGIVGMWKAFEEMQQMGWIGAERPRMVSVQASGCAPIVRAFEAGEDQAEPWVEAKTVASGLRVPGAVGDFLMLRAIRESGGTALSVTDEELMAAVPEMASATGIFPAPEGAATLAGLKKLITSGQVSEDDRVVLFNTGTGLKYIDVLR